MRILIPVDGSECARKTLEWAADTLSKSETRYCLLYVVRVIPDLPLMDDEEAVRLLHEARQFLEQRGCRVEQADYIAGDPVETICRHAEALKADQVLIGSHGRTGLSKLLLGSTSEAVLEKCPTPVFVYRNVAKPPAKTETKLAHKLFTP